MSDTLVRFDDIGENPLSVTAYCGKNSTRMIQIGIGRLNYLSSSLDSKHVHALIKTLRKWESPGVFNTIMEMINETFDSIFVDEVRDMAYYLHGYIDANREFLSFHEYTKLRDRISEELRRHDQAIADEYTKTFEECQL